MSNPLNRLIYSHLLRSSSLVSSNGTLTPPTSIFLSHFGNVISFFGCVFDPHRWPLSPERIFPRNRLPLLFPSNIVRSGEKRRNVVTSVWLRRRIDSRQLWLTSRLIKDSRSWNQWARTLIFRIDGSLDNPWYNTKAKHISSCAPRLNLVLWPSSYRILLATLAPLIHPCSQDATLFDDAPPWTACSTF